MNIQTVLTRFSGKYLLVLLALAGLFFSSCQSPKAGAGNKKALRVLMLGGGSSHDFNRWYKQADAATLRRDGLATVTYISHPDSLLLYLPQTDVLYLSHNQATDNPQVRRAITDFVNAGKGLVLGHAAMWYNWKDWPEYNQQIAGGGSRGHDRYGDFQFTVNQTSHPVMQGVRPQFTLKDERYYYQPDPAGPGVEVLASSSVAGSDKIFPSVFVVKHPKARIVGLALGHDAESHDLADYQLLLRNAVTWVARR